MGLWENDSKLCLELTGSVTKSPLAPLTTVSFLNIFSPGRAQHIRNLLVSGHRWLEKLWCHCLSVFTLRGNIQLLTTYLQLSSDHPPANISH